MTTRTDLDRLENTLGKVKNPPNKETESSAEDKANVKQDFKNFMNSPLQSTNKPINLNLTSTQKAATIGGAGGAAIGFASKNKARKTSKEVCDRFSTDCQGNPSKPPLVIQNMHNENVKSQVKSTVAGGLLGAGTGILVDKVTSGKGLNVGPFKLKIGR